MQNPAKRPFLAFTFILAMTASSITLAEEKAPSSNPLAPLNTCRAITDPAQRVACYDSAIDQLNAAVARSDVTVVDKASVKEARKGLFGFSIPRLRIFGAEKDGAEAPDDKALSAMIKALRPLPDGRYRFTLDTDAVWETTEPYQGTRDPVVGDKIALEKAALGSYFLKIGRFRPTRARRVN